jgi:hypothetical protein
MRNGRLGKRNALLDIRGAQSRTSLSMEHPPCSFRACKIRRRVGSAMAFKMRFTLNRRLSM